MYHCQIHFYFIGCPTELTVQLRGIAPLAGFDHSFTESSVPEPGPMARADVILADWRALGASRLEALLEGKRAQAQLILLAPQGQGLDPYLPKLQDLWHTPLSQAELRFRFQRLQQAWKQEKDFWQTSQYLEATINSVPNLVWYKNKNGIHEKVNDSFCSTVKKTKEQVEGQGHAYIWDVEYDDPVCIESERIVMESRQTKISEEIVQTGEGTRLLTTYKSPLYNVDGSVMGTVGVAIDITQERAYKQEIVRQNQTMEMIFTSMDCGMVCHSMDGSHILSVNRAALKLLGYSSREEMNADGFDMVAASVVDEDKDMLLEAIHKLNEVGDSVSVEYRVHQKDSGAITHVMGNIKVVEENGELFFQRLLLDCTDQKLREMQKERQQMELIHALSEDYNLVCVFDLSTGKGASLRISSCEFGVLEDLFGKSLQLETCMQAYIDTCVYKDDQETMRQLCSRETLCRELADKKQYYFNYRTFCGDEIRYFQMKVVRTGDWEQECGVVLGFRNVDDETRKEMQKKSLLEDALFQANRASKAKSVFLSNMSHDIRTPMNAIVGFTTLAITHIDQKEQVEEYLKKIMTSGNHLVSLINDVLDMSRIESGKMHLEENQCSLPDILHGLRSIIQGDIRAKQLDLFIDTVDVLDEEIFCDKLRLNQVLLNLLSNCIKYTGPGGIVSIRITEKTGAPDGFANYEFYIKDTGIGMSQEFVEHIFEPFERERNSTISGIQGTGLGMAITKNIVDMMNGTIEVRSEQGVGTEFIVTFTFRLGARAKESQVIPKLKNCRALVVDDDFNTCDSVSYMLQQMGLRAEWTMSGREAVLRTRQAIMRNDNYSVYLIDWLMPDMNGVEVARRIRKETEEDVPIIVLTAYDWADIEEEAREAGVTAFCSKPLFCSELRACLHSVVEGDSDAERPRRGPDRLHNGHILLTEDNELNQEIAVAILTEAGFTTEIAENGQVAVNKLKNAKPGDYDLVLMDVQMPVMDGYEATRAIRAMENKAVASLPILAMTANAFEEDKRAALQCGMNGHIAKPIDIEKLLDTLDEILS